MPTPQRLPIVNSDDGVWGDILRQYLLKEHYDDGTDNAVNGGHKTVTIRPGTASAGTAPLKFTTGTLLTTPEAGAMEFAGDNYYLTDTSGPTRRKIAAYDDTSGATGDIYYRNSSGYFTRLGVGSTGDLLTVSGGLPSWSSSISNASTITLKDSNFTLQDNSDTSKQLKFELSGISASTTRTLTVPDASTTIVGTDTTQTLTNKTLTNPVLWSGGATGGYLYLQSAATGTLGTVRALSSNGNSGSSIFGANGTQSAASGLQYAIAATPTINQSSTAGYTTLLINPTETATGSGTKLLADFQLGGSSKLSIDNTGSVAQATGAVTAWHNQTDQTTNYERLRVSWSGNIARLLTEAGGTGTVRQLTIGTANRYMHFVDGGSSVGFYQFAASTGTADTSIMAITNTLSAASGVNTILKINPTLTQSGTAGYTALLVNPTESTTGSGTKLLIDAQVGGVSKFSVDNTGVVTMAAVGTGAGSVVTTDGTQTLTNKTLTGPKVTAINDADGQTAWYYTTTASVVNYWQSASGTTGTGLALSAVGTDTNINANIFSKGAGSIQLRSSTNNLSLGLDHVASAVNYIRLTNAATATAPTFTATGTDTNISVNIVPKGTGALQANGVDVVTISGTQTLTNKTITSPTITGTPVTDVLAAAAATGNSSAVLRPLYIRPGDTGSSFVPSIHNYLAYLVERGGTVSATKNGVDFPIANPSYMFSGMERPGGGYKILSCAVDDEIIITADITAISTTTYWGGTTGVMYDNSPPKRTQIELYFNGGWQSIYDTSNTTRLHFTNSTVQGGYNVTQIRWKMTANASEIWIMELFHIALYNRNLQKWLSAAGGELYGSNASPPTLTAAGADANVDLRLVSKGSGAVQANGNPVLSSVTAVSAVTGTPSASTYLRGDGTWSTPSGGSGGMLAPAQGMTFGDETFTISSGTVTQVSGTTINGYSPAIGDRILVANAPATTGTGSSYSMTSQPTNGIYVVTGNTTNLTVSRATDMSGSVKPNGMTVYVQNATWPGSKTLFFVEYPSDGSAFTWGTTSLRFTYAGGPSGQMMQVWVTENALGYNIYNGTGWTYFGATTNSGNQDLTLPATATDTIVARTSTDTLTNKTLTNPMINDFTEGVVAIGTVTTTCTIDLTNGTVQTATLTASTACTFTMPTATAGKSFTLMLKQATSTGNGTATFTAVKWASGGAPTITATAGKMDILSFFSDGTNWYGSYTQGYTP